MTTLTTAVQETTKARALKALLNYAERRTRVFARMPRHHPTHCVKHLGFKPLHIDRTSDKCIDETHQ